MLNKYTRWIPTILVDSLETRMHLDDTKTLQAPFSKKTEWKTSLVEMEPQYSGLEWVDLSDKRYHPGSLNIYVNILKPLFGLQRFLKQTRNGFFCQVLLWDERGLWSDIYYKIDPL